MQLSAVTKPKTKVGKKRGFATSTPAVKPNKGKSPAKAKLVEKKKSPRKRKQPPIEEDDGGHSDNEVFVCGVVLNFVGYQILL